MTIEYSVLDTFKPFLLGYCNCGCGGEIPTPKRLRKDKPPRFINKHQSRGENNGNYINGIIPNSEGYLKALVPDHPFRDYTSRVMVHRLVMERYLGRYLRRDEEIHYIDKNIRNNNIENLMLVSRDEHRKLHIIDKSNRICLLCGRNYTHIQKDGEERWYKYKDGYICMWCYSDEYRKKKKIKI